MVNYVCSRRNSQEIHLDTVIIVITFQTTIAYMRDDVGADQRTKIFPALQWGKKYCVSLKVEGNGALSTSSMTEQQCLNLPEQGNNEIRMRMNRQETASVKSD